jgi:quercetin dioxygenase-like cupin family protein
MPKSDISKESSWAGRRVVIGTSADGGSTIVSAGPAPNRYNFAPGADVDPHNLTPTASDFTGLDALPAATMEVTELWTADAAVAPSAREVVGTDFAVECGDGRLRCRFTRMGPHLERPLHRTNTTDVDVILDGEVTIVTEDGELLLSRGDVLVIPGAVHGWRTGDHGCSMLVAMIGHTSG